DRCRLVSATGGLVRPAKQWLAPESQTNHLFGAGSPGLHSGGYQLMRFLYLLVRAMPPPAWAALLLLALAPGQRAFGTPVLQLYVEGAVYDTTSNTWVLDSTNRNTDAAKYLVPGTDISHFRLWTIGDTRQSKDGTIHGVK